MKNTRTPDNPHKGHRENVRRRFLVGGLESFASHEVLEFLLYYAIPQKDTNPLAHKLIETYGSLWDVLSASAEELRLMDGVGERTAIFLSLVFEVGRFIRLERMRMENLNFRSTGVAARYLQELFTGERREIVYELCLNHRGNLALCRRMTNGSLVSASADMKPLISAAIFSEADSVIIAHNHPGGDSQPSTEDYHATARIKERLDAVDIELWDHIIVGGGSYTSLRESGFLD